MHKTVAGEKRKVLKREALELEKEVKALARVQQMSQATKIRKMRLIGSRMRVEPLKSMARLEDLHVWQMDKTKATKKGPWMHATGWPRGEKATRGETSTLEAVQRRISGGRPCRRPGR